MSENYHHFIPANPHFKATPQALESAAGHLAFYFPTAEEITVQQYDEPQFVDCGGNLEAVRCPGCGADLVENNTWQELMSAAFESRFRHLEARLPCCGETRSLNDLEYDWPAGFACDWLTVRGPISPGVMDARLDTLQRILGCRVRIIRQHI